MWRLRWRFTRQSPLGGGGHLTILKLVCHAAEHYGAEYDDWNSGVFRSQRNCSSGATPAVTPPEVYIICARKLDTWYYTAVKQQQCLCIPPCVGPGRSPLSLHFPTSYCIFQYLLLFPFFLSYSLHLFSCFDIPSYSTRIVPLRFQAGCCRRRVNLALSFLYVDFVLYVLFS